MTKRTIRASCFAALLTLAAGPLFAQQIRLTARLTGGGEAPTKVTTGAFGSAECFVDVGPGTVSCTGTVFNLPSGALFGHIHVGDVGVAGPVVCNATVTPNVSNDFTFTIFCNSSNIILRDAQGIRSFQDFMQTILGEGTYVNIHSMVNPAGEIRGQLVLAP